MTEHDLGALGAYALGQLTPAATAQVRDHLTTCPSCRAEYDEIAPAAAALADLKAAPAPAATDAPADLAARVVGAVEFAQRREVRSRWLRSASIAAVAGAAAAAIVVGGVALLDADDPASPQAKIPLEAVPVQVEQTGVNASADIVSHTWGVEVKLSATGFGQGDRYRVVVVGTDGVRHQAGEFVGTGAAPMVCNLNSSVLRGSAEGFEVRDRTGNVIVVSHFAR